MPNDPILHLLGLAKKAGKLEIGEEPVGAVCRSRHARVVLLASDAAPNTCRRAAHFGEAGNVLWLQLPHTKEELGFLLGRKSCAMVAVTDFGIAAAIGEKLALLNERYAPAAQQLREKADRAQQRQKEKRQHEKNLAMGKKKPWAAPAKPANAPEKQAAPHKKEKLAAGKHTTGSRKEPSASAGRSAPRPAPRKSGLGGKKLTAKFTPGGKRPSKP